MGLKIQRNANSPACRSESSTLMSARYEYRIAKEDVSSQELIVDAHGFANQNHAIDDEAAKRLFNHIWKQLTANRQLNVEIDLSQIQCLTRRFELELGYLRRQLRRQGRSARLSNISLKCEQDSPIEIV